MIYEDDREYHLRRVRAELDPAYRAKRPDAAAAHMRLSALHMRALRDLKEQARAVLVEFKRAA